MTTIEINTDDNSWAQIPGYLSWESSLEKVFQKAIKKRYQGSKNFSVGLLLTGDKNIQKLNRDFRGMDKATNVLSFPQYLPQDIGRIDTIDKNLDIFLGDIAMSHQQIMRESEQFHFKFFDRCTHLFVHGILHLFGMDHIDPVEREQMENLEIEILSEFGFSNPYIFEGEEK